MVRNGSGGFLVFVFHHIGFFIIYIFLKIDLVDYLFTILVDSFYNIQIS